MRKTVVLCWILIALAVGWYAAPKPESAPKPSGTVRVEGNEGGVILYIVRHAEKTVSVEMPEDPPLSEQGARRAAALAHEIDVASLVAVYATPTLRTKSTAAPSARAAGVPVTEYAPDDATGLVARIKGESRGTVLVVGHSNTVPGILKALGVAETIVIGDGEFGDLFVVTLAQDDTVTMVRKRFGDSKQ